MFIYRAPSCVALALTAVFFSPATLAHVTLQQSEASVDTSYRAVFKVPHGCAGSATTKIHVRVPEGVVGVKPQPKAGWALETVQGDYAKPHTLYGATLSSGVKEVIWEGGPLADAHYDEFLFMAYLSNDLKPGTSLYFPVVQTCEKGIERWIDIPSSDLDAPDDHTDSPAPGLQLLPKP